MTIHFLLQHPNIGRQAGCENKVSHQLGEIVFKGATSWGYCEFTGVNYSEISGRQRNPQKTLSLNI